MSSVENRQPRRIRLRNDERSLYSNGSLSAEAYQQLAAQLEAENAELVRQQNEIVYRLGIGSVGRRQTNIAAAMSQAINGTRQVMHCADDGSTTVEPMHDWSADLQIRNVHNLSTRARFVVRPGGGGPSISTPMRRVQDTGNYPTLEAHLGKRTPAYRVEPASAVQLYSVQEDSLDDPPASTPNAAWSRG